MRKTIIVVALIALAWLGYLAWPIYTLGALARAIEAGDTATAMRHIDLPAVRQSITQQVVDTYLKLTGKTVSPLLRAAVASAAGSIADPIVGKMLAPDALAEFLRDGWPNAVLPDRPPGTTGLSAANLGNAWEIFAGAQYGIRRFELELPPSLSRDRRFVFEFRLIQWRWQLAGVRMPEHLRVRLAEALMKALSKR
jgi:DUF2939 family protein